MGRANNLPPGALSVPALARAMGLRPSAVYHAIWKGCGPALTAVEPLPWSYPAPGSKQYVTIEAAITWLESYEGGKYADALRQLKIERILAQVRNPPPRPASSPEQSRPHQGAPCGYKVVGRRREPLGARP
jgi:hypothetical protein